ncbi:MAG: hypothetical protein WCF56_13905, partial [Pseudolabrys sp.]
MYSTPSSGSFQTRRLWGRYLQFYSEYVRPGWEIPLGVAAVKDETPEVPRAIPRDAAACSLGSLTDILLGNRHV